MWIILLLLGLVIGIAAFKLSAVVSVEAPVTLSIPTIAVKAPIVTVNLRTYPAGLMTWDVSRLKYEVGFMNGTAWFNTGSNTVLGAHSELPTRKPGIFYDLDKLQPGDAIYVREEDHTWQYIVTDVIFVSSNDVSVTYPTSTERLTLLTCDTNTYSDGDYAGRVAVIAEKVE